MGNKEKKYQLWEKLKPKYLHLENYCTIQLNGIDDDEPYFHPYFIIDSETKITAQGDVGNNNQIYAFNFSIQSENHYFTVGIYEDVLSNVIIGWHQNKETVLLALNTLSKVNNHVEKLRSYAQEYINEILIGSSVKEVTNAFINEIKTTSSLIEYMQNNKNLVNNN